MLRLVKRVPAVILLALSAAAALAPSPAMAPASSVLQAPAVAPAAPTTALRQAVSANDYFQFPLPTWTRDCDVFGSDWRLCDGTPLRTCPSGVWRHTGFDVRSGIQPVRAAANGVIAGYMVDSYFKGGVLIRHQTSFGIVITQYWHVWLRKGFKVGTYVTRGQVFADVASMGSRTHFHFAVFRGDMQAMAWRGALPRVACAGSPAFPYRFVDPTAFVRAHLAPVAVAPARPAHVCRFDGEI